MYKKIISILCIVTVTSTLLAGCTNKTSKNTNEKPKEVVSLKYVVPGDSSPDDEKITDAVNQKMLKDGYNLKLQLVYIPWDTWEQKLEIMMSSGEEFDMFQVMETWYNTAFYKSRDGVVPIDSYLNEVGKNIKAVIPDYVWKAGKIDGKTYSIPALTETLTKYNYLTLRKDIFDKYNLKMPTTLDELLNAFKTIKKGEGNNISYYYNPGSEHRYPLERALASFPFAHDKNVVMIDQKSNIKSWIETDEFKQMSNFLRELYLGGMLPKDILTLKSSNSVFGENELKAGRTLLAADLESTAYQSVFASMPNVKLENIEFSPEKKLFRSSAYSNSNVISATSKHPKEAVQFFNWFYANQENYDLLTYGIKDVNWIDKGTHLLDVPADKKEKNTFSFADWQTENTKFKRYSKDASQWLVDASTKTYKDSEVENYVGMGFNFDSSTVATEFANVQTAYTTSIMPIYLGVIDYDKAYPQALKKMKDAGLDKVIAEYKKQFTDWKSKNK